MLSGQGARFDIGWYDFAFIILKFFKKGIVEAIEIF